MKVAILDVRQGAGRVAENSYTVAYRNLVAIRDHFAADLFVNASDISSRTDYDVIVCGFGSTSCERQRSTEFLERNRSAKIFWLIGEYEQSTFAPLFYSRRRFQVIKNFEHTIRNKMCDAQHFLNINTLLAKPQNRLVEKQHDSIYYGRWRPDRLRYFAKYLDRSIHLSTHSKNAKMFHHNGCNPKMISPMGWRPGRETLNLFRTSLYIEDMFTHTHYNCLANRFYEALFCNVAPLFDASCANTLERSGLADWGWHIVETSSDVRAKTESAGNSSVSDRLARWSADALAQRCAVLAEMDGLFRA